MRYVITVIWFEYRRYLAAVLVIAAGTALIGLEVGATVGLVSLVSTPVDRSEADVWVTVRNTPSCDLGAPLPRDWANRLAAEPGVAAVDEVIQCYAPWTHPRRGNVMTVLLGVNLGGSGLGPAGLLTERQRVLLTETGSVVVDEGEREQLGVRAAGDTAEVMGRRVRVVGFSRGVGSVTAPYVICSLETARQLLRPVGYDAYTTTFLLARLRDRRHVPDVVRALGRHAGLSAYDAGEFSLKSRRYWLTTTKAGLAMIILTGLGLAVGVLLTAQSLYAATLALARELALLRALGAPLGRLARFVLAQALVVGLAGAAFGLALMELLFRLSQEVGVRPYADWRVRLGAAGLALLMAMSSGLLTLLSLRRTDPMVLLR